MQGRRDEEPRIWFRSERISRMDGQWYIHTREGIDVGPYGDKFAADVDAELLKSLLAGKDGEAAVAVIRSFMAERQTDEAAGEGRRRRKSLRAILAEIEETQTEFSLDSLRQLS